MKSKKLFMAFLLIFTLMFIPNVFAAEDIEIQSITEAGIGGNASYCPNPTADGLTLSFDGVTFKDKGDYVSYDVVVVNNSNEDYEISNGTSFSDSKYFKYEFTFEGNSNIVPKKSTKKMNIKISYDKDVDPTAFDNNGTFSEENEMSINLAVQQPTTNNPKTGSGLVVALIILFLAVVASISMVLTNKTKLNKHLIMIIALALAIIPVTIYAAKMVTIKLNTEIIIDKNYKFSFIDEDHTCADVEVGNNESIRTFAATPSVSFISSSCVDGYYVDEYNYTNSDLTWADLLEPLYLDEEFLNDIYPEGSNTHVELTDKIIHGTTYRWLLAVEDSPKDF